MANIQCPQCGGVMAVADQHLGLTVACPLCGQQVATAAYPTAAAVAPASAADPLSELAAASTSTRAYRGRPAYARAAPQRPLPFHPGIAAVLSLFIPGAGQMYKGNVAGGLIWLLVVTIGYMLLIVPGLILHVCCIFHAASGSR